MREDTKDLVAVTILIFFAVLIGMYLLWTATQFVLIAVSVFGTIGLLIWAVIRVLRMDRS